MFRTSQEQLPVKTQNGSQEWITWVEKAKAGNRCAFERLIEQFQEHIFRMVYFRTRSKMDAEDLTQEIFIKAFNGLHNLREDMLFKSWLFSIAANRVRDFHRKKKFQQLFSTFGDRDMAIEPESETDQAPDALDDMTRRDFWRQVDQLLEKLSKMEREVFLSRFIDHLSIKEISQVMKKSESTTKTLLYRALQKFRKEPSMEQFLREVNA
jgi:RNA polymerase sigma-70 factor (ECF subfamily)